MRDFRSFSRSESNGVQVAVLVDLSGSVPLELRRQLSADIQALVRNDSLPEKALSVLTFSGTGISHAAGARAAGGTSRIGP